MMRRALFLRLSDMGVEPFLVSSTVEGVMAQRLVRRLCPECADRSIADPAVVPADFPWDPPAGGRLYLPHCGRLFQLSRHRFIAAASASMSC